jgi:hypothetical protein
MWALAIFGRDSEGPRNFMRGGPGLATGAGTSGIHACTFEGETPRFAAAAEVTPTGCDVRLLSGQATRFKEGSSRGR